MCLIYDANLCFSKSQTKAANSSSKSEAKTQPTQNKMKNAKTKSKESKPQLKVSSTGQNERVNRMDSKTHNRSSVNNKVVEEQKSNETKLPQDNQNLPKPNISIKIGIYSGMFDLY